MIYGRLAGGILLLVSGILLAFLLNRRLGQRHAQAVSWTESVRQIRMLVDCYAMPQGDICARLTREQLIGLGYAHPSPPVSLGELVRGTRFLSSELQAEAEGFVSSFGRGYRDEQLKECDFYIERMQRIAEHMAGRLSAEKKKNATLCVCGALALIILLI
ncbi:MAG: hypothetical protein E7664_02910 [Ruminococcaceae bacterium]|nr:hypothetical protein [Oscillospiraceae bacterium]